MIESLRGGFVPLKVSYPIILAFIIGNWYLKLSLFLASQMRSFPTVDKNFNRLGDN